MGDYPDGCVDCETYTPATDEIITGYDVIAGEVVETVEKVCLAHKIARTEIETGVSGQPPSGART